MTKCLLAFSMKTNGQKIFTVNAKENISCLHGIRFLSMVLIIFGHSFTFASSILFLRNPGFASQAPKDFVSQLFANGTFAVDTFFFMSGFLLAYAGARTLYKTTNKWSSLCMFYVHRYLRLTPLNLGVIFTCAFLLRYISSGPNWLASIEMYDDWCQKNWWVNALYIQNFYHTENMCLSHTWYLAADFQMYIVAAFVLVLIFWNKKVGFPVLCALFAATTLSTGIITALNHYPAVPYINNIVPLNVVNAYYKYVYIKSYCRMGPFIVGMMLGLFINERKELNLNKLTVSLCWIFSVASGLCVIYLMWPANQGILPTNSEAAAYSALARTVWGACIGWLVFACYYGYGGFINSVLSWSYWVPFSRLTFPAYLIHPVIMSAFYGSIESPREFSYSFMLYVFIGHVTITYALSFVLSLLFESPVVCLEKLIFTRSPKRKSSNNTEQGMCQKKTLENSSNKQ